jgi:cardiolipin synthase
MLKREKAMSNIDVILIVSTIVYVLWMWIFLISENRRPQATLAWMLVFAVAPVIGVLLYVLFGRERKAFSKQSSLMRQQLKASALPLLSPILSRQDEEIARLESRSAQHRKLMMLVRQNSKSVLTICSKVDIQQDAAAFYPSLIQDMQAARRSIHLQYFIWRTDSFTAGLKEILIEKAKAGVEVRLLYDPLGSHANLDRRYIDEIEAAGARMAPTSPLYRLHTISYRNHRKITVIDGEIGYTGGMNIGKEHVDGGKDYDSWRDTQVRIVGDGAAVLQAVFMVDWYNAVRENLFSRAYFGMGPTASADGGVPVQILASGPDSQWAAIRQLYFFMIVGAQQCVFLQSPYFVLDATVAEALKSAALSGVDVKVMLNADAAGEDRLPAWAANTYIVDVMQAGVRVFLYNKGYLHAKTISIDSAICSIGSANIDIRSFSINYELNAVLYSERHAKQLERDFERDLAYCTEFDTTEYMQNNAALRFRDSVARLFSPLL